MNIKESHEEKKEEKEDYTVYWTVLLVGVGVG